MTEKKRETLVNAKRQLIIETAGNLFVQQGYTAVSMDAIALAAPVSKATLYNHFKDKKDLFQAVILERCKNLAAILQKNLDTKKDPADVLTAVAKQFMQLVLSGESINIHRTMIAEAKEFPELGKQFYQSGPLYSHQLLANYLKALKREKKIRVVDPELSAGMFFSMLKGRLHMEHLLGIRKSATQAEQNAVIKYAVDLFMRAHTND